MLAITTENHFNLSLRLQKEWKVCHSNGLAVKAKACSGLVFLFEVYEHPCVGFDHSWCSVYKCGSSFRPNYLGAASNYFGTPYVRFLCFLTDKWQKKKKSQKYSLPVSHHAHWIC